MSTKLGDIHTEGMLPGNLNTDWMVIHPHCIWLGFCKNPQEATEGEEVGAEVMIKEPLNPATGMFCSPMTSPVTQPCDSEGEKPGTGCAEPQDCGSLPGAAPHRENRATLLQLSRWALMMPGRELLAKVKTNYSETVPHTAHQNRP